MTSKTEAFLSAAEEDAIVSAIRKAERKTSGEIRVHLEGQFKGDHNLRAATLFHEQQLHHTQDRNGVLFYVAVIDRTFVVYGDEGIHSVVPHDFWEKLKEAVIFNFKNADYAKGLVDAILETGNYLKKYFPYTSDDTNELSDEISKN